MAIGYGGRGLPTTCCPTCRSTPAGGPARRWQTTRPDRPQLRGTEPRVWITKTDYPDLEFAPSLRAFVRQRKALLSVLDELRPDDWRRTGTLVGAGRPVDLTAHSYAERLARHERPHVQQIAKALAAVAG